MRNFVIILWSLKAVLIAMKDRLITMKSKGKIRKPSTREWNGESCCWILKNLLWKKEKSVRGVMIKTEYLLHFCHLLDQLFWKTTLFREGDDSKPIDFFSLYFIDEMFEFLVYKTNTYVEQCKKRFLKNLSVSKMKTYSGNSRITMQPFHFLQYPLSETMFCDW